MFVYQVMSRDPRTCRPEDTLEDAARLLWEEDVGALPVTRGGRVVAMLTDRDICMAGYLQGRPLREVLVQTAMSRQLHVARPRDAVEAALVTMREGQVRRLAVVDEDGQLLGLLSINDVTREAFEGELADREVVETLAAIGAPRLTPALQREELVGAAV